MWKLNAACESATVTAITKADFASASQVKFAARRLARRQLYPLIITMVYANAGQVGLTLCNKPDIVNAAFTRQGSMVLEMKLTLR